MGASRVGNSIRNSMAGMFYYSLNLCLNFISRKVFLDYLGAEVLGLNTTAINLLQFLNLAELGIGFAVAFSLYEPIAKDDKNAINEIIALQGGLYKRIAFFIIAGAFILSFFFPLIFEKTPLPLWYAYASFGVLLFSSLLTYFVNYKQILLTASQQAYKITFSYKMVMLAKVVVQIFLIKYLENGYVWWLITEGFFAIIGSAALSWIVRKTFPYIENVKQPFKELNKKYPVIGQKVKQLFCHKIADFAVTQTSPLIIYAFLSLTVVTYYGNYLMIISGAVLLMTEVFNGLSASVGNLIAEGNKQRIVSVFYELFCLRFLLTAAACIAAYFLSEPFISVWIGSQYILENETLALLVIYMYFRLSRGVVDSFINGYGLFKDIWAPFAEAIINLGGSVVGGYFWGLNGIIAGTILSQVTILFIWKPYFLFKEGLRYPIGGYIKLYAKCVVCGIIGLLFLLYFKEEIVFFAQQSFFYCLLAAAILFVVEILFIGTFLYLISNSNRELTKRLINLVIRR